MTATTRFTAADEAVMTTIAAQLRIRGLAVERDAALDLDCYWIGEAGSIAPAWVVYRESDGRYLLRDGLLGLERAGDRLIEILPSEWLSPPTGADRTKPAATDPMRWERRSTPHLH